VVVVVLVVGVVVVAVVGGVVVLLLLLLLGVLGHRQGPRTVRRRLLLRLRTSYTAHLSLYPYSFFLSLSLSCFHSITLN
jgi:hypothetical protein